MVQICRYFFMVLTQSLLLQECRVVPIFVLKRNSDWSIHSIHPPQDMWPFFLSYLENSTEPKLCWNKKFSRQVPLSLSVYVVEQSLNCVPLNKYKSCLLGKNSRVKPLVLYSIKNSPGQNKRFCDYLSNVCFTPCGERVNKTISAFLRANFMLD